MEDSIIGERKLGQFLMHTLSGKKLDTSKGNISGTILLLAIPMVLEMLMESLFSVVDIFFVGKIGVNAVATIGLTESIMSVLYSVSIGLSMAATALIARRVGEKKIDKAAEVAFQAIVITVLFAVVSGFLGYIYAEDLLRMMGATDAIVEEGLVYTQIIFTGNASVVLLFVINGIFRGAGNASTAMHSLWIANFINIVLNPILIFGLGSIPAFGLKGAAYATLIGRSLGVLYQLIMLRFGKTIFQISRKAFVLKKKIVLKFLKLAAGSMSQFVIEAISWIFLIKLIAGYGSTVVAGYTIAYRILMFSILPGWGMANVAATMVGQNLGAGKPDRAETSVWKTVKFNALLLGIFSLIFLLVPHFFVHLFTTDAEVLLSGTEALRYFSIGFIFFACGMVLSQSLNGAGDTKTPAFINILVFIVIQIPLAWVLSKGIGLGAPGVYCAITISYLIHALFSFIAFKRGKWKVIKI